MFKTLTRLKLAKAIIKKTSDLIAGFLITLAVFKVIALTLIILQLFGDGELIAVYP